jgi:benzylsuccinate CoA-transferase BbsE subunit
MAPPEPAGPAVPLADLVVVDATTWLGGYCGRLLADLGADVVRVADPEPRDAATALASPDPVAVFRSVGKKVTDLGPLAAERPGRLVNLLDGADMVLTDEGPARLRQRHLHPEQVLIARPRLIHVSVSPFGLTGPWADRPASDLTLLASGGLLYLGGDPDRPPVRPYGEQSGVAAGLHATVAALMALFVQGTDGLGQLVDVSAQEAVAHSVENAVQYFDCERVVRRRIGPGPAEAGTGLFACRDGWVYLLTSMGGVSLGWSSLVDWLVEDGAVGADELRDPEWDDAEWRRDERARVIFTDIFEAFAAKLDKSDLYAGGQARGVSISPVSTPRDLLANEQLQHRGFFRPLTVDGRTLDFPGPPYRFATLDVGPRPAAAS